jgi:hypothetical protein
MNNGKRCLLFVRTGRYQKQTSSSMTRQGFPAYITHNPGPCDPTGNRFFAITGDHFDTGSEFELNNGQLQYVAKRGDDTVLVRSSNMGDVGRAFISFTNHRKVFADDHVQSQIKDILLRCDLNIKNFAGSSVSLELQPTNGSAPITAPLYTVAVSVKPALLRQGEAGKVFVKLDLETFEDVVAPRGKLSVALNGKPLFSETLDHGQRAPTTDGNRIAFEYTSANIDLPESGVAIVSAEFPDIGTIQAEALVLARTN